MILTNTFRANRLALERHGLAATGGDQPPGRGDFPPCRRRTHHVSASMGPSGKLLMMGEVSEVELLAAYTEQAQALAAGGVVDFLLALPALPWCSDKELLRDWCYFPFPQNPKTKTHPLSTPTRDTLPPSCMSRS